MRERVDVDCVGGRCDGVVGRRVHDEEGREADAQGYLDHVDHQGRVYYVGLLFAGQLELPPVGFEQTKYSVRQQILVNEQKSLVIRFLRHNFNHFDVLFNLSFGVV